MHIIGNIIPKIHSPGNFLLLLPFVLGKNHKSILSFKTSFRRFGVFLYDVFKFLCLVKNYCHESVLNIICKILSLELSRFCSGFASRAVFTQEN